MEPDLDDAPHQRLRVLVVDDHPIFRDGLVLTLMSSSDFVLAGEAGDAETAISMLESAAPELVLMDLRLPGMDGVEATRRIRELAPSVRVVVVSMVEDDDAIFAAIRAGARGYLLKGADRDEILSALRAVALGDVIFGSSIARRVMAFFAGRPDATTAAAFPDLTDRECDILDRLANGEANQEIARHLGLREKTVRNHVSTILNKLQVADRGAAIARARDAGLGPHDGSTS